VAKMPERVTISKRYIPWDAITMGVGIALAVSAVCLLPILLVNRQVDVREEERLAARADSICYNFVQSMWVSDPGSRMLIEKARRDNLITQAECNELTSYYNDNKAAEVRRKEDQMLKSLKVDNSAQDARVEQ